MNKRIIIMLLGMIAVAVFLSAISCTTQELIPDCKTNSTIECNEDGLIASVGNESCGTQVIISDYIWELAISGSGSDKIFIEHTESLRSMARTGNINALQKQLCNYTTSRVSTLKTGHESDINNVGFASQLKVEHYVVAMYHPRFYSDHFIIYDTLTGDWVRYTENGKNPKIFLSGTGD